MNNTRNIRIEGNSFTNFRIPSFMINISPDKWGSGIISIDAGYRVVPRCTTVQVCCLPCPNPIPNTFNNLFQGIYITGAVVDKAVTVDGNIFAGNVYGVRVVGGLYPKITRNTFTLWDPVSSHTPDVFAIYADGAYGLRTEDNVINGIGPLQVNNRSIGTLCRNSDNANGGAGFHDYRNTYTNLETGSQAEGLNIEALKINCNTYNGDNALTTSGIFVADGELWELGSCDPDPTFPESNVFTGSCNDMDRFQVFSNPGVLTANGTAATDPWNYNTYSPIPLGVNFSCFGNVIPINCPPATITPYNIALACPALYTNSSIVNLNYAKTRFTQAGIHIIADKHLIDGGNTQAALLYIANTNSPGLIKNYLLQRSPYLSDEVLIAAINKKLPPGHIRQILVANSSLSKKVLAVVNEAGLPNGIRNSVMAAQTGKGAMKDLLNKIHQEEAVKILATSEIVYNYLDTNQVDSAILFLQNSGIPNALCALVPIMIKRDTIITKQMLATIEITAYELMQNPETASKGEDLEDFCTFNRTLLRIQAREGGYFTMTQTELNTLQELADGNSLIASTAEGILQFVNQTSVYKGALDYNFNVPHSLATNPPVNNEIEDDITMNLYPNPAMEGFSVQLSRMTTESERTTVSVFDMNGKMISTINWGNQQDYGWISTETWPTGIYVVYVNINDKYLLYKKVIVAK